MRRYWIEAADRSGTEVALTGETFHHIVHVCRQDLGSRFEVLPGDGQAYLVELVEVSKRAGRARVLESRLISPLPLPRITLAVSLPRFSTFEVILEKAAELGVARVVPFTSDFSFVRSADRVQPKLERWQKIVRGACEQSGRGELMDLAPIQSLPDLLRQYALASSQHPPGAIAGLFPYEGMANQTVHEALTHLNRGGLEFWIFVGSEGGFSTPEVQLFQSFNLAATTLGPQVLRVETACLALVTIIRYELGQWG